MRRPVTPREVMHNDFRSVEKMLARLDQNVALHGALADKLESMRDYAMTVIVEAPAIGVEKLSDLLNSAMNYGGERRPEKLDRFIRTYLEKHLDLVGFTREGVDVPALSDHLIDRMKESIDLHTIADQTARSFPGIKNPGFDGHMLETVLRESVGLDGRVPEPDQEQMTSDEIYVLLRMKNLLCMMPEPDKPAPDEDFEP